GCASYYGRQYDEAIKQFQETLILYPNAPLAYYGIGRAYGGRRQYAKAIAELTKGKTISEDWPPIVAELGYALAMSGQTAEAQRMLQELNQQKTHRYVDPYLIATVYAGLGDKDQTFAYLDKAVEDRSTSLPWLKVEPKWDNLRSDLRYV